MRTCTRCGIEFEGVTAWCADCTEVDGEVFEWPSFTGRRDPENVWAERWEVIAPLYQEGKYDNEIAAELGLSDYVVFQTRTHAGKVANVRADRYLWHDQAAHQAHAAQMVYKRKNVVRGRKAF